MHATKKKTKENEGTSEPIRTLQIITAICCQTDSVIITISIIKIITGYAKKMIESTHEDGYMARHICHWPLPEYPDYESWRRRQQLVDAREKDDFIRKIKGLWAKLGETFEKLVEISK